jgi:hypothetical protein
MMYSSLVTVHPSNSIRGRITPALPCPLMPREARAFTPGSRHLFASGATSRAHLASGANAACVFFSCDVRGFQLNPSKTANRLPVIPVDACRSLHVENTHMGDW